MKSKIKVQQIPTKKVKHFGLLFQIFTWGVHYGAQNCIPGSDYYGIDKNTLWDIFKESRHYQNTINNYKI